MFILIKQKKLKTVCGGVAWNISNDNGVKNVSMMFIKTWMGLE